MRPFEGLLAVRGTSSPSNLHEERGGNFTAYFVDQRREFDIFCESREGAGLINSERTGEWSALSNL